MLEVLSNGFKSAKNKLTGKAALTEANIDEALRDVRLSLLEADVEFGVVKSFLARVKEKSIGTVVDVKVKRGDKKAQATPGEHFVNICHAELEALMGPVDTKLTFRRPVTCVMLVGLQGTGKTTTAGKLAGWLRTRKRRPLLVAADIYRPAAVEQLKRLGEQLGIPVFHEEGVSPPDLCLHAKRYARDRKRDVVIFDTAGRLEIDDTLMRELEEIKQKTEPDNVLLVCDAMAGQSAVKTAAEFNRRLDLDGFIMTKLDGDARGGAALSIKEVTGKPIKFLGVGEALDKLEEFRPEGVASRILGMGDIVGLMQDFEEVVDEKQAEKEAKKLLSGAFTLDDFMAQVRTLKKVGSLKDIYEKMPIFGDSMPEGVNLDDRELVKFESIVQSMTRRERAEPTVIDESRARRIAAGSGRKPADVKDLVSRFAMMKQLMSAIGNQPGLLGNLPGIKQLSQMRKMRGMDMSELLGDLGPQQPRLPKGLPKGYTPPGTQATSAPKKVPGKVRDKQRSKRKAQRSARKKGRK